MLRVIDEVDDEADSLVKRAKNYYEKKPKLIAMVEDLYRSHCSLAQKHDLLVKASSSLDPDRHNSSTSDELRSEETESEVDHGEGDQIAGCGDDDGETMKEELERLREENRVYKELMMMREKKSEVASLSTNSIIRICFRLLFASISVDDIFFYRGKKKGPVRPPCDHPGKARPSRVTILYSTGRVRRRSWPLITLRSHGHGSSTRVWGLSP
ncbi:unnamed protein product [Microthlaspi erraticum]|uniref:NAB domain-containing protein n=1 Tax=Microthlaspi erraticum TaxID=1685480 RepID=A0A6D2JST2_9BRAS|nr:unnamed protein product [Microthlaspi erraticum]